MKENRSIILLTKNLKLSFILVAFVSGIYKLLDIETIYPLKSYIDCTNLQFKNHFTLRMIGFLFEESVKVFRFAKSSVSVFKSMVNYM